MNTYDPQTTLDAISRNAVAVIAIGGLSIVFFGGGFFHSWQYVGVCVAACTWSFIIIADAKRAGVPMTSWQPRRTPATH